MSLLSVLKTAGKDLKDFGGWVDKGAQIVTPIVGIVDPPLVPILAAVESALGKVAPDKTISAAQLEQIVTALTAAKVIEVAPHPIHPIVPIAAKT